MATCKRNASLEGEAFLCYRDNPPARYGRAILLTQGRRKQRKTLHDDVVKRFERCHPDSNWGVKVLQTFALPLGHGTILSSLPEQRGLYKVGKFPILLIKRAVDEARTRDLHLGKVALYQLSYYRIKCRGAESNHRHVDFQSTALPTELPRHMYGDPEGARTLDLQRDRLAL